MVLNMIEVKKSNIDGRGVFATRFIPKGTEFICDVFLIKKEMENDLKNISIYKYVFPWDRNHISICFGFASFFNHNKIPNIKNFKIDRINLKSYFIALRNINIDEELFINYGTKKSEEY